MQKLLLDIDGSGEINSADTVLLARALLEAGHDAYQALEWSDKVKKWGRFLTDPAFQHKKFFLRHLFWRSTFIYIERMNV